MREAEDDIIVYLVPDVDEMLDGTPTDEPEVTVLPETMGDGIDIWFATNGDHLLGPDAR